MKNILILIVLFFSLKGSAQYVGSTNIAIYQKRTDLPLSANNGQFAFCVDSRPLFYFNGTNWISILDSSLAITNVTNAISTANYNNVIRVSGTTQQLDTGKVYTPLNSSMTTFTLPVNPVTVNNQLITIVGYGSGGFKIGQNASQQILSVNGVTTAGTTGYCQSTSRYTTITLRYIATNFWQLTTLQGAFLFY